MGDSLHHVLLRTRRRFRRWRRRPSTAHHGVPIRASHAN